MRTCRRSLALAVLLPVAVHAAEPSRTVLLVQTYDSQPSDDPLESIPVWVGKRVAKESTLPTTLPSQPLQVFNAGVGYESYGFYLLLGARCHLAFGSIAGRLLIGLDCMRDGGCGIARGTPPLSAVTVRVRR